MKLLVSVVLVIFMVVPAAWSQKTITGKITDYYGTSAVGGARVSALNVSDPTAVAAESISGADGAYSLTVEEGTYYVGVNPSGSGTKYLAQYYPSTMYLSYAEPIDVTLQDAANINFFLYSGFLVTGTATGEFTPSAADALYIYDNYTYLFYNGAVTGPAYDASTGGFSINLPQGIYHFLFYGAGGTYGDLFSVAVNDDIEGLVVETAGYGALSGMVYEADGDACYYASVTAIDAQNGYYLGYAYTDDEGYYEITGLQGNVEYILLAAVYPGYSAYCAAYFPAAVQPVDAGKIWLPAGQSLDGKDITLTDQIAQISGRVTDESGAPIAEATVYDFYISSALNKSQPLSQRVAVTDDDGRYVLSNLAPVPLGVAVVADGYVSEIWNDVSQTTTLALADPIELTNGAMLENIDFTLRSTDSLGYGPDIYTAEPYIVRPGWSGTITLTGERFSTFSLAVEVLDEYFLHTEGPGLEILNASVRDESTVLLTVSVKPEAEPQSLYLSVTNPDGQYDFIGVAIAETGAAPEIGVIAAPEKLNSECTISVSLNLANLSAAGADLDLYFGIILPDGLALFYDGATFTEEMIPIAGGLGLSSLFYLPTTTLLVLPLGGAELPAGEYTWFGALLESGSSDLIDVSLKDQIAI